MYCKGMQVRPVLKVQHFAVKCLSLAPCTRPIVGPTQDNVTTLSAHNAFKQCDRDELLMESGAASVVANAAVTSPAQRLLGYAHAASIEFPGTPHQTIVPMLQETLHATASTCALAHAT